MTTLTSGCRCSPDIGLEAWRRANLRFRRVVRQVRTIDEQRRPVSEARPPVPNQWGYHEQGIGVGTTELARDRLAVRARVRPVVVEYELYAADRDGEMLRH